MKVFLTGASGFIGGHLLRLLLSEGAEVRCLVRASSSRRNLESLDTEIISGDLRDAESVRRAMAGCEIVYHCAADYRLYSRQPKELYASNVEGTEHVLEAASRAGVQRVVYTSSVGALGLNADGSPADENTPVTLDDMTGHYKRSKYLAERVAEKWAASGLPVVIVNPSTPVGDGDLKPTATGRMILDFLNRKVPAFVDTGLNLIDVRDVARGHLLAAERGLLGEKYILGHRHMSLEEIFQTLGRFTGLSAPRVKIPHWLPLAWAAVETSLCRMTGRVPAVPLEAVRLSRYKMYFDARRAVEQLGLPQTPIEEALRRAVDWFQDNGYVRERAS
jgi:dihydroflavonol-4-reductase